MPPYIDPERRKALWSESLVDWDHHVNTPGEMNYHFFYLIKEYIEHKGECYQTYNDIIGVLESCKMEVYRRMVSPYEDKKRKENGDVSISGGRF